MEMTVGELVEALQKFNPDSPLLLMDREGDLHNVSLANIQVDRAKRLGSTHHFERSEDGQSCVILT